MSRSIYWFRNDLRIDDNEGLLKAGIESEEVIPTYILDRSWLEGEHFGIERMGFFRMKFLLESLQDLKKQLQSIGSDLHFRIGNPIEELDDLRKSYNCEKVFAQKASSYEETNLEKAISARVPCELIWGETLYHLSDLSFHLNNLPDVFTQFRKEVEKKSEVRKEREAPLFMKSPTGIGNKVPSMNDLGFENIQPDERTVLHFKGGSKAERKDFNIIYGTTN